MRKMVTMSKNCMDCVFHHKECVLGHRRPWNSLSCDDYRPYCLVCHYPKMYCNTCPNLSSRRLKPLEIDSRPFFDSIHPARYDCVWSSSQAQQRV